MNLIKIYAVITFAIVLVFLGLNFVGDSNEESDLKGDVAPMEEWQELLIGKWSFYIEKKNLSNIYLYEGDIQYFADSTFIKSQNITMYGLPYGETVNYGGKPRKNNECLVLKTGGTISGGLRISTYNPNNGKPRKWWSEWGRICDFKVSYPEGSAIYTDEKMCSDHREIIRFYDLKCFNQDMLGGTSLFEALTFTRDKIVLKEKDLASNEISYYIYKRIED